MKSDQEGDPTELSVTTGEGTDIGFCANGTDAAVELPVIRLLSPGSAVYTCRDGWSTGA